MSRLILTEAQKQFAGSGYRYPAFVGGYGSGKSFAAMLRTVSLKTRCAGQDVAYYLPTYPLVKDIALSRMPAMLEGFKIRHRVIYSAPAEIKLPDYGGSIKFRTMEDPSGIVGYEVAHSVCDELDTIAPDKARHVWDRIIARNRQSSPHGNSVAVATTPEGFGFVWERWVKNGGRDYRIYKARTSDNAANLPDGYIDSLRQTYSSALLAAYLDGEFVNLHAGSVYPEFDRALNHSSERILPGEALHIGLDFNVTKMAAVVFVLRDGKPHAVQEYTDVFDTPAMVALIRAKHPGHPILVYPDASGGSRKSNNASVTDLQILKQGGFRVCVDATNPAVKDRVLAVNAVIRSRELRVNPDTCPALVEALEKQAYDKHGEPDKKSGLDHVIDGAGYFLAYKFPIVKRTAAPIAFSIR